MRFRAVIFAYITLVSSSVASTLVQNRLICPAVLQTTSSAWMDPETRRLRFEAVIAHQNQIRAEKKLPKLSAALSNSIEEGGIFQFSFDPVDAFPDHPIAGNFIAAGDMIMRSIYNDIFSLNYVYFFKGEKLVKTEPFGSWYLDQIFVPTVTLYRQMSVQEFALWKESRFDELGSDWGHGTKVIHFSTEREFTSSPNPKGSPIIKIEIPKATLVRWSENSEVWAGLLNDDMVSEFVLPYERIGELHSRGELKVEY